MNEYRGEDFFEDRTAEKNRLKRLSRYSGFAIILFLIIEEFFNLLVSSKHVYPLFEQNELFYECCQLLIPMISIAVPFLLAGSLIKKDRAYADVDLMPLGKPKDTFLGIIAVPSGVTICLLASNLTGYFTAFLEKIGFTLTAPDTSPPTDTFAVILYVVRLTVTAAVIEEICMRGIVMQSLRRYGDGFALIMSSVIFSLMHCNLLQIPFALIAGIVIGFSVLATGTLWTGILIHFFNNLFSAFSAFVLNAFDAQKADDIIGRVYITVCVAGAVTLLVNFFYSKSPVLSDSKLSLRATEKIRIFILSLPMLSAFAAIAWYTHYYVSI